MGTRNKALEYVNYVNERAIRDPQWFWGDSQDANEARAFLYNLKGGVDLINEIYTNTPPEIQKTISYKKLPTNVGGAGQKKMNKSITEATDSVAPVVAGALTAPVMAGQALATGALGTAGGLLGSKIGADLLGRAGENIGTDLLIGNNRSHNIIDENGTPTVIGSYGNTGRLVGNVTGSVLGGIAGSALGEAVPSWVRNTGSYGYRIGHPDSGPAGSDVRAGMHDLERGMLYGRRQIGGDMGPYMSKTGMRTLDGRFAAGDDVLHSNYWSNPLGMRGAAPRGAGSQILGRPISSNWMTPSGQYEPYGALFLSNYQVGDWNDYMTNMPDFRYKQYTPIDNPVEDSPIAPRPVTPPSALPVSGGSYRTPMQNLPYIESPTDELDLPDADIVGGPIGDNPSIRELRRRNRNMRAGARGVWDDPETEVDERTAARDLTRNENRSRRSQIKEKRSQIRNLRQNQRNTINNGSYLEDQGINTNYRDLADDYGREIRKIRGR